MSETLQEFHHAISGEASHVLTLMSEANRATARAIEAQAHLMDHLLDGIRRFGVQAAPAPQIETGALNHLPEDIDRWMRFGQQAIPIHQQPQAITPGEPGSSIRLTREGREFRPLSPLDEPGRFADVAPEKLAAEDRRPAEIVIIEKPLDPVPENTTLDASGRLVPAAAEMKPDFAAIERMRLEDETRAAERQQLADEQKAAETEALQDRAAHIDTIVDGIAKHEPVVVEPRPAPVLKGDTLAQAVHKAQKAVEHPREPRARDEEWKDNGRDHPKADRKPKDKGDKPKTDTAKERVLNHYAEHGLGPSETSEALGVPPNSVSAYISMGRTETDKRAAQGDLKKAEREDSECGGLRVVLSKEAENRKDIIFPDDDMVGIRAYTVNYDQGCIDTPDGMIPLSKPWLRIMDLLADRDTHPTENVWKAGRFTSERPVLTNLRMINELLAPVKLYIVPDAKYYQICALA